ncbi:MAG: hypothetical protein HOP29_08105 [Phycisphaerales bacterium]|nr:hypothetical protein [Phycisphaerales bacterium]
MNTDFSSVCDEFYVSCRLFLKLDLALERETALHFFDRVRKEFPGMQKFRRRDDGCLVLEEEPKDGPSRRWIRLEPNSLRFGHYAPGEIDDVRRLAAVILEHAPYHLTFSELDYDHLEVVYGFDLEYRGNHDQLLAETLLSDHPLGQFLLGDDSSHAIDAQPYLGIALTPGCDLQAYIETKSRTSSYEVRTGEYEMAPLSVFLTLRKYWLVGQDAALTDMAAKLFDRANELAAGKVVPLLVNPLALAIASRL